MNEKLQYASMLEMPESSTTITYKPIRKRRTKKRKDLEPEAVKKELLDKLNSKTEHLEEPTAESNPIYDASSVASLNSSEEPSEERRKSFKFSTVTFQLIIAVLLIGVIAITNIVNENSGINVFMKSLFAPQEKIVVDEREFSDFSPVFSFGETENITLTDGVVTFSGKGSVYSPCEAVVESITQNGEGLYTLTLSHSANFSSKIEGLKFVYAGVGDKVFSTIPVGYVDNEKASLCFFNEEKALITGYEIIDNTVVWAV